MSQTSRERVRRCLTFETPDRVPRQLWALPWFTAHYPDALARIQERFPGDFGGPGNVYRPSSRARGGMYDVGTRVDDWGCLVENIQEGVHGEVRDPILPDIRQWKTVEPPYDTLPANVASARAQIARDCERSDLFMLAGCCPRPWERYQFIRGTENAMMDVMDPGPEVRGLLARIHEYHLREVEFWASTAVDGIQFMDDWGAQQQLLIPPRVWRELFMPLYKDYCDIIHASGKFVFMHSDGYTTEIFPDLIAIGVDALNSQLFCMDMAEVAATAKGRLTFWGEIDRQHVLPATDPEVGREAVRRVAGHLYDRRGGVIAQFEAGPGTNPDVAYAIFEEWERVGRTS